MAYAFRIPTLYPRYSIGNLVEKSVTFCVMPDHSGQVRSGISFFRPPYPFAPFLRTRVG